MSVFELRVTSCWLDHGHKATEELYIACSVWTVALETTGNSIVTKIPENSTFYNLT